MKDKNFKASAVFELVTYKSVANPLPHCARLLDISFGKEMIHKIILDFIVISIGCTSQHGVAPYHLIISLTSSAYISKSHKIYVTASIQQTQKMANFGYYKG